MKGHSPVNSFHPRIAHAVVQPRSVWRAVWVVGTLTAIVTVLSLRELSQLIQKANPDADRLDWREVAGRAVRHAESLPHLPHLPHHQSAAPGASSGPGKDNAASFVLI
jgi:hypothetical protein